MLYHFMNIIIKKEYRGYRVVSTFEVSWARSTQYHTYNSRVLVFRLIVTAGGKEEECSWNGGALVRGDVYVRFLRDE